MSWTRKLTRRQVHDAGLEEGGFRGPQRPDGSPRTLHRVQPRYCRHLPLRAAADQQQEGSVASETRGGSKKHKANWTGRSYRHQVC
jgi:hypothetical protein